jgi:hypothetical protein
VRLPVALVVLAACGGPHDPPQPPVQEGLAPVAITAPAPFDEVDILESIGEIPGSDVLTPAQLATGTSTIGSADVWQVTGQEQRVVSAPTTTVTMGVRPGFSAHAFAVHYEADGSRSIVGHGEIAPQDEPTEDPDPYPVHLDAPPTGAELWGNGVLCARVPEGFGAEVWAVRGDTDCDGRLDVEDCNPDAYCDLAAPNPIACQTTSCAESCAIATGDACTAGNVAVCRDDLPAPAVVTCSVATDQSCIAPNGCMPVSACEGTGAHCPVLGSGNALLCDVSIMLPYTTCIDAAVVDEGGPVADWFVTISPPCELDLSSFEATVSPVTPLALELTANGKLTRVQLELDPAPDGFCSSVCDAPIADDLCHDP